MKYHCISSAFLTSLFFVIASQIHSVSAASFNLSPVTQTISPNAQLTVELRMDAATDQVRTADALLSYDPTIFRFVSLQASTFFPVNVSHTSTPGLIRFTGSVGPNGSPKQGSEVLATLRFTALNAGASTISFVCNETGSNIFIEGNQNVLNCTSLTNGTYTVGSSSPPAGNPGGGGGSAPTSGPYFTPVPGTPTCDACGKCGDSPEPPNYGSCQQCVSSGSSWTAVGCVPTNAAGFVQTVLRFIVPLVGGIAFLGLLGGGFLLATSSGDPIRIAQGKSILFGSIGALLIVIFAVFILNFVGMNVLGLPGF